MGDKTTFTNIEMLKYLKQIQDSFFSPNSEDMKALFMKRDRKSLMATMKKINVSLVAKQQPKRAYAHLKKDEMVELLCSVASEDATLLSDDCCQQKQKKEEIETIHANMKMIHDYIGQVKVTLDKAVHGHENAKRQIERIIGQWINGEQDGYCLGFEGMPGVGKTTFAVRGLSDCLKDEKGNSRPFAMIQIGGDSNGNTLNGYNYTYMSSTWGKIVQILMDKKCMNPIIFIDEVDKISRTEQGREIVGILTHLLDSSQNNCFQDKYFSGIDLDLSKALFILSYNDVEAIDKVLLDRIHRIKFDSLTLKDKLIIANNHLLPEVYKKMGLEGMIHFKDEVLRFIIDEYTAESGVRKFKEVLFEIVGEINVDILKHPEMQSALVLPIEVTVEDVIAKYMKNKPKLKHKPIHTENKVGVVNGMWANSFGRGGIVPIQVNWRPSEKRMELFLTGMQGDVMKESMNVAFTLAWSLLDEKKREEILANEFAGIHVHCPEGATPKDGPSAGTAITTAMYSMFTNRKIKHDVAITGEICLNGHITEIGGLDLKITGAIKAGVKTILYPAENEKDFQSFMERYNDTPKDIQFHAVRLITEVFDLVFE